LAAGLGAGVAGGAGVAAELAVSAEGRSFRGAVESTGASCKSRFRLSADATSRRSLRPQAATEISVSAASIVLDIDTSSWL
jgi:hypothetical protein